MSNDFQKKTFRSQLGISATVQRETVSGDASGRANAKLLEIGRECNPKPENLEHLGSAAFHVYYNETLEQVFFVSQTGSTLGKCPESLAQAGTKDFIGTIMENYGKRRPKLRSGF